MEKLFIAALAGSAGSQQPIEQFFDHTPHDDVSFVILRHLPKQFKTMFQAILSKHSALRALDITNGMVIQRDTIYVAPAGQYVRIHAGRFVLEDRSRVRNQSADVFMKSLAAYAGDRAIGVVLSGTWNDGTEGIRAIREAGGLTIAQQPDSCAFSSMPESAIATGCIHRVADVTDMPAIVHRYVSQVKAGTAAFNR